MILTYPDVSEITSEYDALTWFVRRLRGIRPKYKHLGWQTLWGAIAPCASAFCGRGPPVAQLR